MQNNVKNPGQQPTNGSTASAANRSTGVRVAVWAVALTVVAVAAIVVTLVISGLNRPTTVAESLDGGPQAVREDSHRLSVAGDGKVTLVEFLDFECEVCGAAYPVVEQLRERYDGQVTFVARYFPITSHRNAENAALAAEAAARQDKFEEMYRMLFETQPSWGEQQESKAPLFREYAGSIGLDLDQYDADLADPTTMERVRKDADEGYALGVQGTPTFFLNGEMLEVSSGQSLVDAIDAALAE
ncbi:MAG: hypothetical protein JWQ59_1944 [Cryobacterium sp.]|nr:hypothetical protein [Cryobacterium sp.]